MNGCITCPWHGFQYKAGNGCSPPPFTEVLLTYPVRIVGDTIWLSPIALPPGTKSEGIARYNVSSANTASFFIGWQSKLAPELSRIVRIVVFAFAALVPVGAGKFGGDGVVFLLAGPTDEPLRCDVQLAGTLVEVKGALELRGDIPVLRVESLAPMQRQQ